MIDFNSIKKDNEIREYIIKSDEFLMEMGFTEHSFAHVERVAKSAGDILEVFRYSKKEIELAKIAGFMHDIGNMINRVDHAHNGAILAFNLLKERGFSPSDIAQVCGAIGNHDESTGNPVSAVSAALILADKSDVRRTRVRIPGELKKDIHDRVNYAVTNSYTDVNIEKKEVILKLEVDIEVSAVMEYFEIFLGRMLMCKKAAEFFDCRFRVIINDTKIL